MCFWRLLTPRCREKLFFFCSFLFVLILNVSVNSYFQGKIDQAVNQSFVHIRSHVTNNNFFESAEGAEWPNKWFHDQPPPRFGTGPGSNSRPLELQSASRKMIQHQEKWYEYAQNALFDYFLRLTMLDRTSLQLVCCRTIGKAPFSLCRCSHGSSRCRTAGIPWCTGTHFIKNKLRSHLADVTPV